VKLTKPDRSPNGLTPNESIKVKRCWTIYVVYGSPAISCPKSLKSSVYNLAAVPTMKTNIARWRTKSAMICWRCRQRSGSPAQTIARSVFQRLIRL